MRNATPEQRFWAKVRKSEGCWTWSGSLLYGYGRIKIDGRMQQAHRYSWVLHHGEIPEGRVVDHICHNKACVNPVHLRLATVAENVQHRKGSQADSKSGHRGVSWSSYRGVNDGRKVSSSDGRKVSSWCR